VTAANLFRRVNHNRNKTIKYSDRFLGQAKHHPPASAFADMDSRVDESDEEVEKQNEDRGENSKTDFFLFASCLK